jgi:hypothetical protein
MKEEWKKDDVSLLKNSTLETRKKWNSKGGKVKNTSLFFSLNINGREVEARKSSMIPI